MRLAAWSDLDFERQRASQNPSRESINIERYDFARGWVNRLCKIERPKELGCDTPHVAFRKMDSRANSTAGAVTVVV